MIQGSSGGYANVRQDETILAVVIWNSRQLNTMKECLQNTLLWFGTYKKMIESSWPSKFQKFESGGSWLEDDQVKYGLKQ